MRVYNGKFWGALLQDRRPVVVVSDYFDTIYIVLLELPSRHGPRVTFLVGLCLGMKKQL